MATYQHIMLPIPLDADDNSLPLKALNLIEDCSARFSLLVVIDADEVSGTELRNQVDKAKRQLFALGQELVVPVFDQHVRFGKLGESIARAAQELGVDSIILGVAKKAPQQGRAVISQLMNCSNYDLVLMNY